MCHDHRAMDLVDSDKGREAVFDLAAGRLPVGGCVFEAAQSLDDMVIMRTAVVERDGDGVDGLGDIVREHDRSPLSRGRCWVWAVKGTNGYAPKTAGEDGTSKAEVSTIQGDMKDLK